MQQMADQPSFRPLRPSPFFDDDRSARPLLRGTVARGQLNDDEHYYTGKVPGSQGPDLLRAFGWGDPLSAYVDTFPYPVMTAAELRRRLRRDPKSIPDPDKVIVLERGQERFNIYCAVCHDRAGTGDGMIPRRGFTRPPSFITDYSRGLRAHGVKVLLRDAPVGYFFDVITNGYGAMPDYAVQVPPADRWAIIAYIRALQLSQHATLKDVPDAERRRLNAPRGPQP
jgi:mono/diheme cytochrome c family protein